VVVYRNLQGTFTRSVTAGFIVALIIMLVVRGKTTLAVPYYGIGVFMPIMVMGMAVRKHIMLHEKARKRAFGLAGASLATGLAALVFVGQIVGKWREGGWVVLISFSILILAAHAVTISPLAIGLPHRSTARAG
jgi:peptidoglycan/LPS O-acetylase OafA/YrhL